MALTICTYFWGEKYPVSYVEKLEAGLKRHLKQDHRFVVITDRPNGVIDGEFWRIPEEDGHLLKMKGCFARLRLFDPEWLGKECEPGDRIVCMDLDMVITGALDGLFDREEPFTILQGVNSSNPCPFNGSLWMLRVGYRPDVWHEFSPELAAKVPFYEFPDDQAWLADMMPDAGSFGPEDGVYAFQKKGWPKGEQLPKGARIVCFPGWRDPSQYTRLDWVQQHWHS